MRVEMRWAAVVALAFSAGCVVEQHQVGPFAPPPVAVPGDPDGAAFVVTNATVDFVPGAGVGYYVTYDEGGHWHVRWSCDSNLSGYSCFFDGSILAAVDDQFANLVPVRLEGADSVWFSDDSAVEIDFSAVATVAEDGFDFDAAPGAKVSFDLLVDGVEYAQFVFFPSGQPSVEGDLYAASPLRLPMVLQPTLP